MPRALRPCSNPTCPNLTKHGRCEGCKAEAERLRGTRTQRGYGHKHRVRFRDGVLTRDPLCVCTNASHGHGPVCLIPSKHADHHPHGRDELIALDMDPDDPRYGRGLCRSCHSKETARKQPGGWNSRTR